MDYRWAVSKNFVRFVSPLHWLRRHWQNEGRTSHHQITTYYWFILLCFFEIYIENLELINRNSTENDFIAHKCTTRSLVVQAKFTQNGHRRIALKCALATNAIELKTNNKSTYILSYLEIPFKKTTFVRVRSPCPFSSNLSKINH